MNIENESIKTSSRPPTKRMIEKLKECMEKESSNIQMPCLPEEMESSLAGLYKRGFIDTKMEMINRKKVLCVYRYRQKFFILLYRTSEIIKY